LTRVYDMIMWRLDRQWRATLFCVTKAPTLLKLHCFMSLISWKPKVPCQEMAPVAWKAITGRHHIHWASLRPPLSAYSTDGGTIALVPPPMTIPSICHPTTLTGRRWRCCGEPSAATFVVMTPPSRPPEFCWC
jgi:hypothetical protein